MTRDLPPELSSLISPDEEIYWEAKPDLALHCHLPLKLTCSFAIVVICPVIWFVMSMLDPSGNIALFALPAFMTILIELTVAPITLVFLIWLIIKASQVWNHHYVLTDQRFILKKGFDIKSIELTKIIDLELIQDRKYKQRGKADIVIYSLSKADSESLAILHAISPPSELFAVDNTSPIADQTIESKEKKVA
ncbi:MAG: PH domain-containing protein [Candidatus Caenarcaniphilales bacterium]|nr:PH domain-containing protein [Candidatus Caenarcaniphilales bacterium]